MYLLRMGVVSFPRSARHGRALATGAMLVGLLAAVVAGHGGTQVSVTQRAEAHQTAPAAAAAAARAPATVTRTPTVPLAFAPNRGQAASEVRYTATAGGFGVAFARRGVGLSLGEDVWVCASAARARTHV